MATNFWRVKKGLNVEGIASVSSVSSPEAADLAYESGSNKYKYYTGTAWVDLDAKQEVQNTVAGDRPNYRFDGNTDYVKTATDAKLQIGASNITMLVTATTDTFTDTNFKMLAFLQDVGNVFGIQKKASSNMIRIQQNADTIDLGVTIPSAGNVFTVGVVMNYNAATIKGYMNGISSATSVSHTPYTFSAATACTIGDNSLYAWKGNVYRTLVFNYMLSDDQMARYSAGKGLDWCDIGGSMTALVAGYNLVATKRYRILARNTLDFTTCGAADNNVGTEFIATVAGTLAGTDSVLQLGAILDLEPEGVTPTTWYDSSTSALNGVVSFATAVNFMPSLYVPGPVMVGLTDTLPNLFLTGSLNLIGAGSSFNTIATTPYIGSKASNARFEASGYTSLIAGMYYDSGGSSRASHLNYAGSLMKLTKGGSDIDYACMWLTQKDYSHAADAGIAPSTFLGYVTHGGTWELSTNGSKTAASVKINTGSTGASAAVGNIASGQIAAMNWSAVSPSPVLAGRSDAGLPGIVYQSWTTDANIFGDTRFEIANTSGTVHTTTTRFAYVWSTVGVDLGSATRGGSWTFGKLTGASPALHTFNAGDLTGSNVTVRANLNGAAINSFAAFTLGQNTNDFGLVLDRANASAHMWIARTLNFTSTTGSLASPLSGVTGYLNLGSLTTAGIWSFGATTAVTISAAGVLQVHNTTDATTVVDGALMTEGGLSVAKAALIGGQTTFNAGTANSFSMPVARGTNWQTLISKGDGSAVWGSVAVAGDIPPTNFNIAASVSSPASVSGFLVDGAATRSFVAQVSVFIDNTVDLVELFTLEGIYRTSDSTWRIASSSVGDSSGVAFYITAGGQVQYTNSSAYTGVMSFRTTSNTIASVGAFDGSTGLFSTSVTAPLLLTDTLQARTVGGSLRFKNYAGTLVGSIADSGAVVLGVNASTQHNRINGYVQGNYNNGGSAYFVNGTSDAADNGASYICGANDAGAGRGAYVSVFGNEHATHPGKVRFLAGTGASAGTAFDFVASGGTSILTATDAGAWTWGMTNTNISHKLYARPASATTPTLEVFGQGTSNGYYVKFSLDAGGAELGKIQRDGASSAVLYTTTSDERLKKNFRPIENAINICSQLAPSYYEWIDSNETAAGFGAQTTKTIWKFAVSETDDRWGIDYGRFTPLLVKAIQEQQALITALQARLTALEAQP